MRVLHIVGTMDLGGLENYIMNIYRNIDREQVKFDFVVHNKEKNYYEDEILKLGGVLHRVSSKKNSLTTNILDMYKLFKNNKYDVIHIHTNSATCLTDMITYKICKGKDIIVHSHSTNTKKEKTLIHKIFRPFMNKLTSFKFACSDKAGEWLFGKNVTDVKYMNNAIDVKRYLYDEQTSLKYRKKYGVDKDTLFIGHIGNFSIAKNHIFLMDIFKSLTMKNKNVKMILVGEGLFKKDIINIASKYDLNDYIIFAGQRDDVPEILSAIDVLLLPSLYEGFPVTLVEAQAAGLMCIISDVITQQVVLTDLVEQISLENNPEKWAEKTLSYSEGYNRRNTYEEIVRSGFDIKNEAIKLQDFYLELR